MSSTIAGKAEGTKGITPKPQLPVDTISEIKVASFKRHKDKSSSYTAALVMHEEFEDLAMSVGHMLLPAFAYLAVGIIRKDGIQWKVFLNHAFSNNVAHVAGRMRFHAAKRAGIERIPEELFKALGGHEQVDLPGASVWHRDAQVWSETTTPFLADDMCRILAEAGVHPVSSRRIKP
jgi:hypothetical protein